MATAQYAQESPALEAPTLQAQATALGGAPSALPEEMLEEMGATARGVAPTLVPPTEAEIEAAEEEGVAAWHTGKKITALWSNQANRNAYIAVSGLGWKKLSNANDSCMVSMTMMAAHAEQTNATVNIRLEADGMVHEIYVW